MPSRFFAYILAGRRNGTLYVGMTDDLARRVSQQGSRESAFMQERQLKRWNRAWKLELIEASNPQWHDLADEVATLS